MMGYRYQNKLDQANEEAFWSRRPIWQRRFCRGFQFLIFIALVLMGLSATVVPVWQFANSMISR